MSKSSDSRGLQHRARPSLPAVQRAVAACVCGTDRPAGAGDGWCAFGENPGVEAGKP